MNGPRSPRRRTATGDVQTAEARIEPSRVHWGTDGLVPAVVRDATDGAVLMLAYMDAQALALTQATGLVHFHSRSRNRLWQKGETSGNVLRVRDLALDCDADALLVSAEAAGPTCHTGRRSCFDPPASAPNGVAAPNSAAAPNKAAAPEDSAPQAGAPPSPEGFAWLEDLWATIAQRRAAADPSTSYTARLLASGVDGCARKVTEEATEVLLAARDDAEMERGRDRGRDRGARAVTRAALSAEVADLVYHLLVLCAERGLDPREVLLVLRRRHQAGPAAPSGVNGESGGPR